MRSRPRPYVTSDQASILDVTANHIEKVLDQYNDFGTRTDWAPTSRSPQRYEEDRLARHYGPTATSTLKTWTGTELVSKTVRTVRYWDSSAAAYAGSSCLLLTSLGGQYLEAIRILLRTREVLFAPAPLARCVFEIAGIVFWILDPSVTSVRDRAARVMLLRINDATRRKTAGVLLGHPEAPKLGGAVHALRKKDVPELFFPSELGVGEERAECPTCGASPRSEFRLRGQTFPGLEQSLEFIVNATRSDWNTSGTYAFLSNASHPSPHLLYEALQYDDAGRTTGFAYEDASLPYRITRLALLSFLRSWKVTAAYRGLDQTLPNDLEQEVDQLPSL